MPPVGWETYFERLGPFGLRLVVNELLDDELATGVLGSRITKADLSGPDRAQIVADELARSASGRGKLLTRLDEMVADPAADTSNEEAVRQQLAQMLRQPDPAAAKTLHRLARAPKLPLDNAELRAAAEIVAPTVLGEQPTSRPKNMARVASDQAGVRRLEQERRELEARLRQLESQLTRALERSATLEEGLSRRLNELNDVRKSEKSAREERQRLEKEIVRLKKRMDDLNERRAKERTGEVTTALRRLTKEQRRSASLMDKLRQARRDDREQLRDVTRQLVKLAGQVDKGQGARKEDRDQIREHTREIARVSDLLEKVVTNYEAQSRTTAAAQEEILRQLSELRVEVSDGAEAASNREAPGARRSKENQRVGVFVDVQNMFYSAREKGARLDFEALLDMATADRQLVRAVAYLVEAPEIDQRAFIHLLQMKAYEVKRKPLRIRPDRTMKGNWDMEMALDMLTTADHMDVAVLVSGDGDFLPLARQLKLLGLRVEVYGFTRSTAPDLRQAADRFFPITKKLLRPLSPGKRARSNKPPETSRARSSKPPESNRAL